MAGGEAGSKVVRLVAFLGAGVLCTTAINLWRDFERKSIRQKEASRILENQPLGEMRGPGFKNLEDQILCEPYLLNTTDGEIGAYQTKDDMWRKIRSSYNHEAVDKNNLQTRNVKSLRNRWDKISSACVLFGSCIISVEGRNQSGINETEIIKQALELYPIKALKRSSFIYLHCWEILKAYPKWSSPNYNQVGDGSSNDVDGTPISVGGENSEDTPQNDISGGSDGRGLGSKAIKARRRLHREKDPMWEEMMNNSSKTHQLLEKQLATIDTAHQTRMYMEQRKLEIKQKKYECKQRQIDMREAEIEQEILSKNLADMTPFSKAYSTSKKQAVVDGMSRKSRASRSLNFSDDGSGGSHVGGSGGSHLGGSGGSHVGGAASQNYDNSHINTDVRGSEGFYHPNMNDLNNASDTYGVESEFEVNNDTGTIADLNVPWRRD